jgi:hypothetical protein
MEDGIELTPWKRDPAPTGRLTNSTDFVGPWQTRFLQWANSNNLKGLMVTTAGENDCEPKKVRACNPHCSRALVKFDHGNASSEPSAVACEFRRYRRQHRRLQPPLR